MKKRGQETGVMSSKPTKRAKGSVGEGEAGKRAKSTQHEGGQSVSDERGLPGQALTGPPQWGWFFVFGSRKSRENTKEQVGVRQLIKRYISNGLHTRTSTVGSSRGFIIEDSIVQNYVQNYSVVD